MQEGQTHTPKYVVDTSFLLDVQYRSHWIIQAMQTIGEQTSIIVPDTVEKELKKFSERKDADDKRIPTASYLINYINNNTQEEIKATPQPQGFSSKLDAENFLDGMSHRTLSKTDKSIIHVAYELARKGEEITIITKDKAIHTQAMSAWKYDGLDIKTISPWTTPQQLQNIDLLVSDSVFSGLDDIAGLPPDIPKFLAIASNLAFGKCTYSVAFGFYVNKTHQISPPQINGVEYIKMFEYPFKQSVTAMAWPRHRRIGIYNPEDKLKIKLLNNPKYLSYMDLKRLDRQTRGSIAKQLNKPRARGMIIVEPPSIEITLQDIDWARIEDVDFKRHSMLSLGELNKYRIALRKAK